MSLDFKLKIPFIINVHNKMKLLRSFESMKEVFVFPLGEYTFHPGQPLIMFKRCRVPEEGGAVYGAGTAGQDPCAQPLATGSHSTIRTHFLYM